MSTELRDRFFALSAGAASADEVARYLAEVDATGTEPTAVLDGLTICWHPTARHKQVRFVDAERIEAGVRELFARPSADAPYLAAVFVDPRELSLRTFENIVPLDRLFEDAPLDLDLLDPAEFADGAYTFALRMPDEARARLERLDDLGLYVPPLNAGARGGERFIFHSALLAEALTDALGRALPPALRDGFSHVNPVFRCNRFEPGDARFHLHRDTPYYDAERRHVSRHTVLLYLTGGTAEPAALDLAEGAALTSIGPFTCVVFDQRYEHEGAPYHDGRKVFLRTELIHTEDEVAHDPEIGALFSKACYLTGESVFAPELARHANRYYDQVAAAHWSGLRRAPGPEPFLHKQFKGVHFVANGYDFWFAESPALPLAECAAIALLDYFNCTLDRTPFRSLCDTDVVEAEDASWIPAFLRARPSESAVPPIDKSFLFPEPEKGDDGAACCPFHGSPRWDATRADDIVELYARAQTFAKAHIMPAPIVMLGEDVLLDPDRFVVQGDAIHVLGKESLTPVNFAACWNSGGHENSYIDVASTVGTAQFLVPPILFTESDGCYHLRFDFFRNSWTVRHEQAAVPVPMIYRGMCDDGDPFPWLDTVDRALVPGEDEDGGSRPAPWWVDGTRLSELEELTEAFEESDEYRDEED